MLLNYNDRHHVFRDVAVLVIDAPSPAPPRILEGRARTVLHGGYTHVRVFLPKDIHNRSPRICADAPQEKTPSTLSVGGLADCLSHIS